MLTASLTLTSSNVRVIGEGMGVTNLVCAASVTGNTPAIAVGNGTARSDLSLTASTTVGSKGLIVLILLAILGPVILGTVGSHLPDLGKLSINGALFRRCHTRNPAIRTTASGTRRSARRTRRIMTPRTPAG